MMSDDVVAAAIMISLCVGFFFSLLPLFMGVYYHRRFSAAMTFLMVMLASVIAGVVGGFVMTVVAILWLLIRGPKARQ